MAKDRLTMRNIREILRLKTELKLTHRQIARCLGKSVGAVGEVASLAKKKGLDWQAVAGLSDEEVETQFYGGPRRAGRPSLKLPELHRIHEELKRPCVTLALLHFEYRAEHADGLGYSAFCRHYRDWVKGLRMSMRQVHKAGEKAFIDYAGKKPQLINRETGEVQTVELFVGVLGASSFTYAEATATQRMADFIGSQTRMLEYFGGATALIVPDQLRTAVGKACRYEPMVQRSYEEFAAHYQTAIMPARPRKPKDKAKVEVAVQVVERWILMRLRHETFYSLEELNARIRELLDDLNDRPMKAYGQATRRDMYERLDKPALIALPKERYVYADWKKAKVNIDYHVEVNKHYYSVPHALRGEVVEVKQTATVVEVFFHHQRVAVHPRSYRVGQHTTVEEHMPKAHQRHLGWSPSRLIHWAQTVGPQTAQMVTQILERRPHPEMGYRSCLGIMRLSKQYGAARVEAACSRALSCGAYAYRNVESILKNNLDKQQLVKESSASPTEADGLANVVFHDNVRGPNYFN